MADPIVTLMVASVAEVNGQSGLIYAGDVGIDKPLIDFIVLDFNWRLIINPGLRYVLKNPSGFPIEVALTNSAITEPDPNINNITQLGGTNSEIITDPVRYVWARALVGKGYISRRLYGVVDPSDSIPELYRQINDHGAKLTDHVENHNNPHVVTKAQIGLDQVANFPPATDVTAMDPNLDAAYMSPRQTTRLIKALVTLSPDIAPQSIVKAVMGVRPTNWDEVDCSLPTQHIVAVDFDTVTIREGLQVTYADQGYTRYSNITTAATNLDVDVSTEGIKYVYCDMDSAGTIVSYGITPHEPKVGYTRDGHPYDFFCIPQNTMYDFADRPIRRTYIGKIYVNSGAMQQVIPSPLGTEVIVPFNYPLFTSTRYLVNNPFIEDIDVQVEVLFNGFWGPTGWGYQAGITAHRSPQFPTENIIVQCGQMGFLAAGKESGTPHGNQFVNVTEPENLTTRLIIKKHFSR